MAPGGVALAVWTYGQVSIDAGIDERIGVFYREELATTGRWSVHSWTQAIAGLNFPSGRASRRNFR